MNDKIASITPYIIPAEPVEQQWWARKAYILVRLETREGLVGWGECHLLNYREDSIVALVNCLAKWLIGSPTSNIRAFTREAFGKFGQQRPGPEVYSAFAGIEIAMWDVLGKQHEVPVHKLFGGSCHERLPVYANIYSPNRHTAEEFAEIATQMVDRGHTRIKLYPFSSDTQTEEGVAILQAVSGAVKSKARLAVDLWRHATPARALSLARAMEPYDLLWIEDPFAPEDAVSMRYLRDRMQQPLLSGETLPSRREFVHLFEHRAVDIINPDICQSGILEFQAIASMAEALNISISPHNSNSMALGTAAAINACAGISNISPIEYFPLFESALDGLCSGRPSIEDGSVSIGEKPGLGIEFDEEAMTRFKC